MKDWQISVFPIYNDIHKQARLTPKIILAIWCISGTF